MTKAFQQAIERLQHAPQDRQDALAALLVYEMDEDERWADSTAANLDNLRALSEDILAANRRGECEVLDPDKL